MWKHPKVARARRDSPTAADPGASGRGRIRPRNEAGTDGEGNDDDARGRIHGPARRPGVALEGLPLVDDIYLYESVEEGSYSFNAIFRRNDEIDMFSGMIPDQNTIDRILELGLEVLESLSGICAPPRCAATTWSPRVPSAGTCDTDAIRASETNPRGSYTVLMEWLRALRDGTDTL